MCLSLPGTVAARDELVIATSNLLLRSMTLTGYKYELAGSRPAHSDVEESILYIFHTNETGARNLEEEQP